MVSTKNKGIRIKILCELLVCVFYVWYYLPICNALFWSNSFKLIFFGCFAIGSVGLMVINGIRVNGIIVPVMAYLLVFLMLFLANVGDASAHIRVSFTFWGTALLYFGILDEGGRLRIGRFLLSLYAVTVVTSAIGVLLDNSAARTIAHAAADDSLQTRYKMMNIASIYLFQCLICFVPVLVFIPKNRKQKAVSVILLVAILLVLLNASFTISLIVFVAAIVISVLLKGTTISRMLITVVIGISALVFMTNGGNILFFLSRIINNEKISMRFAELAVGLSTGVFDGDAGLRWELYAASLSTFFENPFGVGVYYSYMKFDNGIGYHSQFLDDLARYGVYALAFYIAFFAGYYNHLRSEWRRVNCPQIANVVTLIYALLLVLNLGFRSADESIVMLFIMPVLPRVIEMQISRRKADCLKGAR